MRRIKSFVILVLWFLKSVNCQFPFQTQFGYPQHSQSSYSPNFPQQQSYYPQQSNFNSYQQQPNSQGSIYSPPYHQQQPNLQGSLYSPPYHQQPLDSPPYHQQPIHSPTYYQPQLPQHQESPQRSFNPPNQYNDNLPQGRFGVQPSRFPSNSFTTNDSPDKDLSVKTLTPATRISQQQCEKFSTLAKEAINFASLSVDSDINTITKDNCDVSMGLIVGGVKAREGELPHMAAVGYETENGIAFGCSGSLISEKFVLSAAHCKSHGQSLASLVRIGAVDLRSRTAQDFAIESFIRHENYDALKNQNDIALIKLMREVVFSSNVRPACLWQQELLLHSQTIASGFGSVEYEGSLSNDLLKVRLEIFNNTVCRDAFENPLVGTASQICAGSLGAEKRDTCQGDSGGPIQVFLPDSKCVPHIIGVTSFGRGCGFGIPAIYTRVSFYIDWIESKVWNTSPAQARSQDLTRYPLERHSYSIPPQGSFNHYPQRNSYPQFNYW